MALNCFCACSSACTQLLWQFVLFCPINKTNLKQPIKHKNTEMPYHYQTILGCNITSRLHIISMFFLNLILLQIFLENILTIDRIYLLHVLYMVKPDKYLYAALYRFIILFFYNIKRTFCKVCSVLTYKKITKAQVLTLGLFLLISRQTISQLQQFHKMLVIWKQIVHI